MSLTGIYSLLLMADENIKRWHTRFVAYFGIVIAVGCSCFVEIRYLSDR